MFNYFVGKYCGFSYTIGCLLVRVLDILLSIQLPANVRGKQQMTPQVSKFLSSVREVRFEFLAAGFSLAQHKCVYECCLFRLPFKQTNKSFKKNIFYLNKFTKRKHLTQPLRCHLVESQCHGIGSKAATCDAGILNGHQSKSWLINSYPVPC